jgi:hypothetical protein
MFLQPLPVEPSLIPSPLSLSHTHTKTHAHSLFLPSLHLGSPSLYISIYLSICLPMYLLYNHHLSLVLSILVFAFV